MQNSSIDYSGTRLYRGLRHSTWAEQKDEIVTKLLPALRKLVDKRYKVTNKELLDMLYGRWRSRHREYNIRI